MDLDYRHATGSSNEHGRFQINSAMIKRITLLVLMTSTLSRASIVVSNADVTLWNGSSYDTSFAWGAIAGSAFALGNPSETNYFFPVSRSGENWGGWWQSYEERYLIPYTASHTAQVRLIYSADDNGGLVNSNIVYFGTNMALAPQLFYNGTALTNEGYSYTVSYNFPGETYHDSSGGDGGNVDRNFGTLVLSTNLGITPVDMWHMMATNGWSTDQAGARILGFSGGSHPYQPGYVAMTVAMLSTPGLGYKTNFGYVILDWTGATASSNNCAVANVSKTANTITANVRWLSLPMGWFQHTGIATNTGSLAFGAMPALANWNNWIVRGSNFVSGTTYYISINGTLVDTCTGAQLNTGRNWFTNCVGPIWSQRNLVYMDFLDVMGLSKDGLFTPTHNAGSQGPLGDDWINVQSWADNFYNAGERGSTYVGHMASHVASWKNYFVPIYADAAPITYAFSISDAPPPAYTPAPFR